MGGIIDIIVIGVIVVGAYYAFSSGLLTEAIENVNKSLKDLSVPVPGLGGVAPIGGGGGVGITPSGAGCPGGTSCGPCRPQSGGIRCECDNYKGAAYEATFCGTWSGDDLSIKMWGPKHSGSDACCWCILNTSPEGEMKMRGEGPHPDTQDIGPKGSVGGKPTCVKAVISPGAKGAHIEAFGLVGGAWKKGLTYDGPCGLNKKSTSVAANQQVSFRCDGSMSMKCATVKPIGGGAVAQAAYARRYWRPSNFDRIGVH